MISDDTDVLLWGRDSIEILSRLFPSSRLYKAVGSGITSLQYIWGKVSNNICDSVRIQMSCKDWTCIPLGDPLLGSDDDMNILHYSTRDSSRESGIFGLLLTLALFVGTWHWDRSEWCLYNSKERLSKLIKTNGPRAVGVYETSSARSVIVCFWFDLQLM